MKRWLCLLVLAALLSCTPGDQTPTSDREAEPGGAATLAAFPDSATTCGVTNDEPLFPKSPPPQHLIVVDGLHITDPERFMLVSLEGILAKTEPRLYFYPSPLSYDDGPHEEENRWLGEMEAKWGVTHENLNDPWAILALFLDEVEGFVVFDPALPQTVNVATTLAGLERAVLAHPDIVDELTALGLTAVADLRGQFTDNVVLYTWAFAELWPRCNHGIMAFLQANLAPLRDYLVTHDVFTMQLDPHHYAERPLLEEILAATPRDIPIMGWPLDELLGVMLFSRYGKYLVAADFTPNLSAHSGLPAPEFTQTHITEWLNLENKIHVAFAYTDGDSLAYANRWMPDWFDDPAYDQVPIGWEISCSLVDVAPDVLDFYFDRLTDNNFMIGPVSGVGYIYPNQYGDLDVFMDQTRTCLSRADLRTLWLLNDDLTLSDELANRYGAELNLLGIFMDYWPTADKGWYFSSNGTPVVHSQYTYLIGPEQIADILDEAALAKEFFYPDVPTFVFIGVNGWITSPTYLKTVVDGLDDRYTVVRPDGLFAAMRAARAKGLLP